MKQAIRAAGSHNVQKSLDRFLLAYRNSPHSMTKETPAMLFMGPSLRSRLDLMKPNISSVLIWNYRGGSKWLPATVFSKSGPLSYTVELTNGSTVRRHIEQIIANNS